MLDPAEARNNVLVSGLPLPLQGPLEQGEMLALVGLVRAPDLVVGRRPTLSSLEASTERRLVEE